MGHDDHQSAPRRNLVILWRGDRALWFDSDRTTHPVSRRKAWPLLAQHPVRRALEHVDQD
jgi:hypothetical protein